MEDNVKPIKPPCSEWNIWKGAEIEGKDGIGVQTLFIRSLEGFNLKPTDDLSSLRTKSGCSRVWFCKEFTDWPLLKAISKHFDTTCVECTPKSYFVIPAVIRNYAFIYVKVDLKLKPGDHICVGEAYNDEAFKIGCGVKVSPEMYLNDRKIK